MARIGGRSLWLAWPVGVLCAGVVGALVWLALPAVPGTVNWIGDTLRAATSAPVAAAPSPVETAALDPDADLDCRTLYPDRLWAELTWGSDVLLDQDRTPPATSITALVDALQPVVRVTCSWRSADGQIVTTLSRVAADASTIADAALRGQGFDCETFGDRGGVPAPAGGRRRGAGGARRAVALQRRDVVAPRGLRNPARRARVGLSGAAPGHSGQMWSTMLDV